MKQRVIVMLVFVVTLVAAATAWAQGSAGTDRRRFPGSVYTMSNGVEGNQILIFDRLDDGRLVPAGSVATGGTGTGAGLGNQGGLVLTRNERWLLAVNAGSHTLSVFEVRPRGLRLVDVAGTGGLLPISVAEDRGVVYVVHAGSDNVVGFTLGRNGRLRSLEGSARSLSGSGVGPAQIAFTPDGAFLMITEKNTNKIVTFRINASVPTEMRVQDATGVTPFGFAFGKRDQVFVTEAFGGAENASALSSYEVGRGGTLRAASQSAATGQTAACWAVVTPDGRFAFAANAGSGSISGFGVDFDGRLTRLDDGGRTGVNGDGSGSIDLAIGGDGRYLYNLNAGTQTIGVFRINADGSLTRRPSAAGLPVGVNGLVSR